MTSELQILREYIRNEMGYSADVSPDDDLLENKILDSFNIIELALFIQKRFQVELEAEDLVRENLAKLSSMIALIEKRKSTAKL